MFAGFRPDTVFHLAAQADVRVSVERPGEDAEINVVGTINVLAAAQEQEAKLIFSSTGGAIYGECSRPAREDDPLGRSPRTARPSWPPRATSRCSTACTTRSTRPPLRERLRAPAGH